MNSSKAAIGLRILELAIVIAVIVGLCALTAPKLVQITRDVQISATTSIASALSSANASNYVARKLDDNLGVKIKNCLDVAHAMLGGIPPNYRITSGSVGVDTRVACTLIGPDSTTGIFTATGIG